MNTVLRFVSLAAAVAFLLGRGWALASGPQIDQLLPGFGHTNDSVGIYGSKLDGALAVKFNGMAATFSNVSDLEIQAVVPAGAASGPVTVFTSLGTVTSVVDFIIVPQPAAPVVSSFSPASGKSGDAVLVIGSNFVDVSSVKLGAFAAVFNVVSETNLVLSVPDGAGSGNITVTTAGGTAANAGVFMVAAAPPSPVVFSFAPGSGGPGQTVTISGANFAGAAAVVFSAAEAAFQLISDTELSATVPADAGDGPITVVGPNGSSASSNAFVFISPPPSPKIFSFQPTRGKVGREIVLNGSGFTNVTKVRLGGLLTSFLTISETEIRAAVPAGATSAVFQVTSPAGSGSSADEFIVDPTKFPAVSSVTPAAVRAGEPFNIAGLDLENTVAVLVNGREAAFVVNSNGTVEAEMPRGVTPGPLWVYSDAGFTPGPSVQMLLPDPLLPRVTRISPIAGVDGDTVHLFGANLSGVQRVTFGGLSAQFLIVSDTEISAQVPAGGASGVIAVNTTKDWAGALTDFVARKPGPLPPTVPLSLIASTNPLSVLGFDAMSNQAYRVELATSLGDDAWQTWRQSPARATNTAVAAAIAPVATAQFFRLMPLPPRGDNWDFEEGLLFWRAAGNAFDNQPTSGSALPAERVRPLTLGGNYWHTDFPIGVHREYWIGTAENHPNPGDPVRRGPDPAAEALTGTLTSGEFRISSSFITFLIGGTLDVTRVRVELEILPNDTADRARLPALGFDGDWVIVTFANAINSEVMNREVWDVRRFRGRVARVRIVDQSTTGHINVDDFEFPENDPRYGVGEPPPPSATASPGSLATPTTVNSDSPVPLPALIRVSEGGQTRYRDPVARVWGFADTHAHPMSYLGLGGRVVSGRPDGPVNLALRSCEAEHGIGGTGICPFGGCVGNSFFNLIEGGGFGHRTSGWENDFDGWPSFNSHTHQAMYVEWIRRAWQGGLRLMVAHAVNNEFLGSIFAGGRPGHAPFDDRSTVDAQITELRAFVGRHSDFMEIALSPRDARRIIHEGRLAVVLGVEVDTLGGFRSVGDTNSTSFNNYLDHLYHDLGVRHIFPVHLADSAFGGCAIYKDLWVANNLYLRRQPFRVTNAPPEIQFRLYSGGLSPAFVSLLESFGLPHLADDTPATGGHVNARGFGSDGGGAYLVNGVNRLGFVTDIDHMSSRMRSAWQVSRRQGNISGHSGFVEMSWRTNETAQNAKLPHEADLDSTAVGSLSSDVGMVSPILFCKDVRGWGTQVANDCAGSAKSWAQLFLYARDHLFYQKVGLATDYLLSTACGPRFGPDAAYALVETPDSLRQPLRNGQVDAQTNGVRYASPLVDFRPTRFNNFDGRDLYDAVEMDFWVAAASHRAGARPDDIFARVGLFAYLDRRGRVSNFARGLAAASDAELLRPGVFTGDAPWEQRAAFLVKNNLTPGTSERDPARVHELYPKALRVWQKWLAMDGENPPLQRCTIAGRNGSRDYDLNLDGLAHYGLLPDFLQDCRNVGLTADDLSVLFQSADAYIAVWAQVYRP